MVAAGHPATAEAGTAILCEGGNAIDAAVAAVCTAFIAEPVLTGAGGGGFLLFSSPHGKARLYDGFARMPAGKSFRPELRAVPIDFGDSIQTFHIGQASVATPSLLAMLFRAHREHGQLPLIEALAPALHAARHGIRLNALQASFIELLRPILTHTESCRALHAPEGELLREGEEFRNPELANTLEMLAIEGIAEMYHGDLAKAIVRACLPHGLLGMDDLRAEQVAVREPLRIRALGGELLTNPPPSSGGILIAYALGLLERLQSHADVPWNVRMAEVMRAASSLRGEGLDTRIHEPGIDRQTLDPRQLDAAAELLRRRLDPDGGPTGGRPPEPSSRHGSTTHISIIDRDGMAVSVTSSNGEGSGIVVPGSGIHLNNMLGEEDINPHGFHMLPAGTTLSSMMAPTIFLRDGRPSLILGSGGSNRLRGAILQVLARSEMLGEAIEPAVHAPRLHNESDELDAEPGLLNDSDRGKLMHLGWRIREWSNPSVYFGGVNAIRIDARGNLTGAGDPRRGGTIAWT